MKVLLLNGSCEKSGTTSAALEEIVKSLNAQDIETEIITTPNREVRDCCGCGACRKTGKCVFDGDIVNEIIEKAKTSDGFIFATPVYYAHPTGRILSVLDRVFYAGGREFSYKPGAAVAIARRSGTTASLDVLNKYFTINHMPVVSSEYWNNGFGKNSEEILSDKEGLQIMRTLGLNMAWLLKSIDAGAKVGIEKPQLEERVWTNFVR